jgi:GH15 family glucan-1,4-alpha-glucosidase
VRPDEIKQDILDHGLTADGVLRQHYDTDSLDASTLLAAMFGFLPSDDERLHGSVMAMAARTVLTVAQHRSQTGGLAGSTVLTSTPGYARAGGSRGRRSRSGSLRVPGRGGGVRA